MKAFVSLKAYAKLNCRSYFSICAKRQEGKQEFIHALKYAQNNAICKHLTIYFNLPQY